MKKQNPLLAKYEAALEARYQRRLKIGMQIGLDAAMIAANEVLGLGAGRAERFVAEYIRTVNEIAGLFVGDGSADPAMDYSKEVLDRRLRQICGADKFESWERRYTADGR